MNAAFLEARDPPPDEKMNEFLTVSDIGPGEHRERIDYIEGRGSQTCALYLKRFQKPVLLSLETVASMARDFGNGNSAQWSGREVTLSATESGVSIKALVKTSSPAQKPSVVDDLADLLERAITAAYDRNKMAEILRSVADRLLSNSTPRI